MNHVPEPVCNDSRPCFARVDGEHCVILTEAFDDGLCPFCKPRKSDDPLGDARRKRRKESEEHLKRMQGWY